MRSRISTRRIPAVACSIVPIAFLISNLVTCADHGSVYNLQNPYARVDWTKFKQYKANLHTHTSMGEAEADPSDVIDRYKDLGYSIIAITDHDDKVTAETTWPWRAFQKYPKALNMVAIQGNEISEVNHMGSYYNDYGNPDVNSEEEACREIERRGGVAIFNHPGRYGRTVEWYEDLFRRYDHLIGFEIYNEKDRYPTDRLRWDSLLTRLLPDRSVWGFANDDMHEPDDDLGFSWNILLLPRLKRGLVRKALESGRFFYAHASEGHADQLIPVIEAITFDERLEIMRITASNYETVLWISQGHIIHRGDTLRLKDVPSRTSYVRAEVHGVNGAVIGTQPFYIHRPVAGK